MGMSPHEWGYFALMATLQGGMKVADPGTGKTIPLQKSFGVCPLTIAAASETRSLPTASACGVGSRIIVIADQITGSGNCTVNGHYFANEGEWVEFHCLYYNGANAWVATGNYGATPLEISRVADLSARYIAAGSTKTLTVNADEGKTILLDTAAGCTVTLPTATIGARFRFLVTVKPTSNQHRIIVSTVGSQGFAGPVSFVDQDTAAVTAYAADGTETDDHIDLNGTTKGGQVGDWIDIEGITNGIWAIRGLLTVPAGSNPADPFGDT